MFFFFVIHKTAYDSRISDLCLFVCSSDLYAVAPVAKRVHCVGAGGAFEVERSSVGRAVAHQPGRDAARAVAALLRGRAVGVPDPVGGDGAGAGGRLDGQDLVAADAGVAVGQRPAQFRRWLRGAVAQVDAAEIIAGAVHLAETQRSEDRLFGTCCVSPCSFLWSPSLL